MSSASVLVAYGTKNGSTREIAEAIADEIRGQGIGVDCLEAKNVDSVEPYTTVVLGSAVYMKRWRRGARRLLSSESKHLAKRKLWIFSSGPCGEQDPDKDDKDWLEPPKVIARAEELGAREHVVFGGRVPAEPSNFVERAMVQNTPEDLRDLRDWDEIRAWARRIAAEA